MFSIAVSRPNEAPIELTPVADSVRFSTAALGGFGACSFGLAVADARRVPHNARVRLYHGSRMLWEGRVEDKQLQIRNEDASCTINCFGYVRLLEEASVRRIWLMRSIAWRPALNVGGLSTACRGAPKLAPETLFLTVGQIDIGNLTRVGVKIEHVQASPPVNKDAMWAVYIAPDGITLRQLNFTLTAVGNVMGAMVQDSVAGPNHGTAWNLLLCQDSTGFPVTAMALTLTPGCRSVLLGLQVGVGSSGVAATYEDIRILGSTLNEDPPGAMYGDTILRDLLKLVPGLQVGIIERGTEFALQSIVRTVRDSAMSVVQEVAAFYDREWGVWEDRRFDWKAVSRDEPDWVIPLASLSKLDLTATTDGLTRKTFLIYQNAATGEVEEQSTSSNDRRNPYVRSGDLLDTLVQAPSVMTALSGAKLASRNIADRGGAPVARGRLELPATAAIRSINAGPCPAMFVRAGDNVVLPDVPTDNYFQPQAGADGQTMFHVRSTETDMETGQTTLELDAFTHRSDILMARIAAATRTFSGG